MSVTSSRSTCGARVRKGIDPLAAERAKKTAEKLDAVKAMTFGECAAKYLAAHEATWKNAKHAAQWHAVFEKTKRSAPATAPINNLPVSAINTDLALRVLEPIWTKTPETA